MFAECRRILPDIASRRIVGTPSRSQWLVSPVMSVPPISYPGPTASSFAVGRPQLSAAPIRVEAFQSELSRYTILIRGKVPFFIQ